MITVVYKLVTPLLAHATIVAHFRRRRQQQQKIQQQPNRIKANAQLIAIAMTAVVLILSLSAMYSISLLIASPTVSRTAARGSEGVVAALCAIGAAFVAMKHRTRRITVTKRLPAILRKCDGCVGDELELLRYTRG